MPAHTTSMKRKKIETLDNDVHIVDNLYLQKTFVHHESGIQDMIDETVHNYRLNSEQERAFRIVANHATCEFEMLKMYLGGMGGTGKSQVIKALVNLFTQQKEEHIFLILAPTGSAATLLNGSTYHSVFDIND